MAIEIKELIVRVTVNNNTPKASENKTLVNSIDRKEIIKECVEKVLEKLELKSLR
jgi:hypothetical protein